MNHLEKILKWGCYLPLALPLFFTDFTFFPWHFGKTMIFQIIVEILLVIFLLLWARGEKTIKRFNFLDWSILIFLIILTVTAVAGINFSNSFWGNEARANGVFTWWHFGIFYFLLVNTFKENKDWMRLFSLIVAVGAVAALTSIFPSLLPASWVSNSGGGIIGNRAFLAYFLSPLVGLGMYLFLKETSPWHWPYLGAVALYIVTLILVNNRGAFLGLAIGILAGLIAAVLILPRKKYKFIVGVTVFTALFCAIGLFFILQNTSLGARFPRLYARAQFYISSGTGATRIMAWTSALKGVKERPLSGWGMGNYEIVFSKYYSPLFLKYGFSETVWDKPHNWLLEIGMASGILGVAGYVFIYAAAIFFLFTPCGSSPVGRRPLAACGRGYLILFSILSAYFIQSLFLFETTNTLLVWFLILAFISATRSAVLQSAEKKKYLPRQAVLVVAVIVVIFSLYRFNFIPLRSSYYLRQAEKSANLNDWIFNANKALDESRSARPSFEGEVAVFLAEQFVESDKLGNLTSDESVKSTALNILKVLRQEEKKYPDNLSYPTWAGQVLTILGARMDAAYYTEAEDELRKAVQISPQKQESWFLLGRLLLLKKDFTGALLAQTRAVEIEPSLGISHWFLGLAKVASGDLKGGLLEIEKARELGYNLTMDQKLYVLDLYAEDKNYKKLIEEYGQLAAAEPDNVNWQVRLATVYALSGDKKSALDIAKKLIISYPDIKADAEKFIKDYKLE